MVKTRQTSTKPLRRRSTLRGHKGGATGPLKRAINVNIRKSKLNNNKPLQTIVDRTIETTQKIGMKGGIAALAGGAAGIAIGAMISNMNKHRMANQIADDARHAAEEISKRANELREAVDEKG